MLDMFVRVDKFLPYVIPYTKDCPNLVARRAIRDTIIEIAARCGTTTMSFTMTSNKDQAEYEVELPHGYSVEYIDSVTFDGTPLKGTNREMLNKLYPGTTWKELAGSPAYYMHTDSPNLLVIVPAPAESGKEIKCEARFRFTRAAELFPAVYYDRYAETVAAGALYRITAMTGQNFADITMVAQWSRLYAAGISEIKLDTARDYTRDFGHVYFRGFI